jgi:hypothetical protein
MPRGDGVNVGPIDVSFSPGHIAFRYNNVLAHSLAEGA